jgi:hypothetical protein
MEVFEAKAQHRAMKTNHLRRNAAAALSLILTAPSGFPKTPASQVHLTVRVFDYVGVAGNTRRELAASAARILRAAGVDAEFVGCLSGQAETGAAACPGRLGPSDFVLRIVDARLAPDYRHLAYSAATRKGGAYVTLFVNPEQRKARVNALSDGVLFGHAAAHELGHLLLGPDSHSDSGIMRPFWTVRDEEWMAKGALCFDSGQASRMRSSLTARATKWTAAAGGLGGA